MTAFFFPSGPPFRTVLITPQLAAFVTNGVLITFWRSNSYGNVTIRFIGNVTLVIGSPFVLALPLLYLCFPKTELGS